MGRYWNNTTVKEGALMKTTGVVRRIDDLGRIVIPKDIRKSLRIRDGESLEFFVDKETISLKKFSTSADLSEIAQSLLDSIYTTINKSIFVTDRDKFVAGSGKLKKDFCGFNNKVHKDSILIQYSNITLSILSEFPISPVKGPRYPEAKYIMRCVGAVSGSAQPVSCIGTDSPEEFSA